MSTELSFTENVSIITFNNVPAVYENTFICDVFQKAAGAGINIDMISQAPATSEKISFGFTFMDADMPKLLLILNDITAKVPGLMPMINTGNVKFRVKNREMETGVGFASRVFLTLKAVDCLPLLITTGSDEISALIYESDRASIEGKFREIFL